MLEVNSDRECVGISEFTHSVVGVEIELKMDWKLIFSILHLIG